MVLKRAQTTSELTEEKWEAGEFVTFPAQLHDLLGRDELNDCLHWSDNGTAVIFHLKHVTTKLLGPHFQGTKFASFTRKLNRWGFRKNQEREFAKKEMARGGMVCYSHRLFRRDDPDLLSQMSSTNSQLRSVAAIQQYGGECPTPECNEVETRSRPSNMTGSSKKPEKYASLNQGCLHRANPRSQVSVLSEFTSPVSFASDVTVSGLPSMGLANLGHHNTLSQLSPLLLQTQRISHMNDMLSALQPHRIEESHMQQNLQLVRDYQLLQQRIATSTTVATSTPMPHVAFSSQNPAATVAFYEALFLSRQR